MDEKHEEVDSDGVKGILISDKEKSEKCKFCDPDFVVLYGVCKKCGRKGEPTILNTDVPIGILK